MYALKTIMSFIPFAFALALTACDKPQPEEQAGNAATANMPVYTVAMSTDYSPFEFMDENGHLAGFDIDLLDAIAEKEGFQVDYKPYAFDRIIPAIQAGTEDMSASSVFISDDRKELVDYSNSYFTLPMYAVGLDNPNRPQTINDIFDKKVTISDHFLLDKITKEHFVPQNNEIIKMDSNYLAYNVMYTGEADVMVENIMTIKEHVKYENDKPLFYLRLPKENSITVGYITEKGNTELMSKLNSGIEKIKTDGTYDRIYNKWFGDMEKVIKASTQK